MRNQVLALKAFGSMMRKQKRLLDADILQAGHLWMETHSYPVLGAILFFGPPVGLESKAKIV